MRMEILKKMSHVKDAAYVYIQLAVNTIKKYLNIEKGECKVHNWKPMHVYYNMHSGERGVDSYCKRCGEWLHTNSKH